eukprot:4138667-Pyramimonas_sp.AAC.1
MGIAVCNIKALYDEASSRCGVERGVIEADIILIEDLMDDAGSDWWGYAKRQELISEVAREIENDVQSVSRRCSAGEP